MNELKTIVESKDFIVLDKYNKIEQLCEVYQSEATLEKELINDLCNQGYELLTNITSVKDMLSNIKIELQRLNETTFTEN